MESHVSESKIIRIAAAIITDSQGKLLLVRKRNTAYFMQPGGKIEPGEEPRLALVRELMEELSLVVTPEELTPIGEFSDTAANEPGHTLVALMYRVSKAFGAIKPAAEIEEVTWLSSSDIASTLLAPLTANSIIPLVWPTTVQD